MKMRKLENNYILNIFVDKMYAYDLKKKIK